MNEQRALIAGVTGIVGNNLASHLLSRGWSVHGISRSPQENPEPATPISVDLRDASAVRDELGPLDVTHVFFCTWARCATETENCRVNGAMLRNLLEAIEPAPSLRHVALVTGLKHYLGPFEIYGQVPPETPFREDQPRLPYENWLFGHSRG